MSEIATKQRNVLSVCPQQQQLLSPLTIKRHNSLNSTQLALEGTPQTKQSKQLAIVMFKGRLRRVRSQPTATAHEPAHDRNNDEHQQQHQQHVVDCDYSIPLKSSEGDLSSASAMSATAHIGHHASTGNPAISALERRMDAEVPFQTSELSTFDACIEAADAMAANDSGRAPTASSSADTGGGDNSDSLFSPSSSSGIADCSVLVSPDGALLFLPQQESTDGTHEIIDGVHSRQNIDLLTNMYPTEEVRSAVVTGSDLHPNGDRKANGFSVRGWSDDAASLALRRSDEALRATASFVGGLDQIKREEAARIGGTLCSEFRQSVISSSDSRRAAVAASAKKSKFGRQRSAPREDPNAEDYGGDTDAMISSSFSRENKLKTSPLFFPGSTLHAAAASLIQYHTTAIGSAGATRMGLTPTATDQSVAELQVAAEKTAHRAANREAALTRANGREEEMEAELLLRRQEAKSRWDAVQRVEEKVQKEYERRVRERSRELYNRKRQSEEHLSHLKDDADGDAFDGDRDAGTGHGGGADIGGKQANNTNTAVTDTELWHLVNQIGSEEDSSFHPLGLPEPSLRSPTDKSLVDQEDGEEEEEEFANDGSAPPSNVPSSSASPVDHSMQDRPPLPPVDRGDVEYELNLPPLRAAALEADSEVEDAATNVLNALSALDTTERSARIAAESALLSAANAQAEAIKSVVQQERIVLEARLKQLDVLERQVNSLNVRADLDAFIAFDRRERPGSATRLGEDDDGGVASALAVLDGHAEGSEGGLGSSGSNTSLSSFERFGGADDPSADEDQSQNDKHKGIALSREEIDKVIANLFAERSNGDDGAEDIDDAGSLVLAVSLRSSRGRSCRASTCYALNKQRSIKTEIATNEQFDGLCRVFYALLKGCDARIPSDVANAKMCMMLSQTFYVVDHDDVFGDGGLNASNEVSDERKRRLFVKATLVNHPFFSQEDFWVQALFQCVTESLVGSGVVNSLNFDTHSATDETTSSLPSVRRDRDSDSNERRQRKWYELNGHERAEAASQVHAVIFAQLGALSHSMLEFGCDQAVAVAFVRRLSIQHQLPLSQRSMLLQHIIGRRSVISDNAKNDNAVDESPKTEQGEGGEDRAGVGSGGDQDTTNGENDDGGEDDIGLQIDDPFRSTCTVEPVPGSNRLVALLSRGVSDRTQSAHQQHCLAILKARKTPYCVVDGMDPRQKARRDELFLVSGMRGHYPQFFLLTYDDAGNEAGAMFLGGCDRLKDLNDTVDLSEDILQANPDFETWHRLLGECK